jgi:hypothetical protein
VFDRQETLGAMVLCIQVKNCDHDSLSELSFDRTVEMTRDEFKLRHHCRLNPNVRKNPSSSPFLLRRERRLGASGRILATHPPTLTFSSALPSSPRTLALFLLRHRSNLRGRQAARSGNRRPFPVSRVHACCRSNSAGSGSYGASTDTVGAQCAETNPIPGAPPNLSLIDVAGKSECVRSTRNARSNGPLYSVVKLACGSLNSCLAL